jgi:hypothetical protein
MFTKYNKVRLHNSQQGLITYSFKNDSYKRYNMLIKIFI